MHHEKKTVLTIVTVTKNDACRLKDTIDNIASLGKPERFEHLVIDASDDYKKIIYPSSSVKFKHIRSNDSGIYDAMNAGLNAAKGEWVLFINSGDLVYDINLVEKLKCFLHEYRYKNPSVIYSTSILKRKKSLSVLSTGGMRTLEYNMPFSHQSCIIKKDIHLENHYLTKLKFTADHYMLRDLYRQGACFLDLGFSIAVITDQGVADRNRIKVWKERLQFSEGILNKSIIFAYIVREFMAQAVKIIVQLIYKVKK